ncbi:MAG: insulinase family protein, partial [Rhodothermales bacterium]
PAPPPADPASDYGVYYIPKEDVTQSTVLLGHPGEVRLDHPDRAALTVMNQILSGGFSSRLFQNVRDDQGLAYSVFGGYSAGYDRPGRFFAGVMTKSETTVEAAQSVLREIEKMREASPTDEEMAQAKDSYFNSFVFNFDTRREIVNRMMTYEYYGYPKDFLDRQKAGIEQVEKEDVLRVSKQYLKPDEVKILAVGNDADFGEPLATLGDVAEIDITIPTGEEPLPEATEETLTRGRQLLNGAIVALGGAQAFGQIKTIRVVASSTVTTPDNMQVATGLDVVMAYPDRARLVQKLPGGEFVAVIDGANVFLKAPQGSMAAPPTVKRQLIGTLWRDLAYLFAHAEREGLEVQYLGQETAEGRQAEVVQITPPGDAGSFKLYLDPETLVPFMETYRTEGLMGGAPTPTREVLSDFRTVNGVKLPFLSIAFANGDKMSETMIESIEINVAVDDTFFE